MPIIEITSLEYPGVEMFGTLTDAQLRNRINAEKGILCYGRFVIRHVSPYICILP